VNDFVSGKVEPGTEQQIRSLLETWRDNDDRLSPLLQESSLLHELRPQSQSLSALGAAGLQALDYLDGRYEAPAGWEARQLQLIQQASQPTAQVRLAIVPGMEMLIKSVKEGPGQQP
jgi:hypothetical protein